MNTPPPPIPKIVQIPPVISKVKTIHGPTTGYRDGLKGIVETKDFMDGRLPPGWFENPIQCNNCTGSHITTKYVIIG